MALARAGHDDDDAGIDGSFDGELGAAVEGGVLDLIVELGLPAGSA